MASDNNSVPYTNREIDSKFTEIMETLDRIETQTTKTNGSVTSLRLWRSFITGGMAILTVLVIPLLGWSLLEIVNFKETVHIQVQAALQDALASYSLDKK